MNVIDLKVMEELAAIVEKVAADAAIKGAVITSGKDTFCAGADLTMLEMLAASSPTSRRRRARRWRVAARLRGEPQALAALPAARNLRQAVGRGDQRHRARRRLRAVPRLPPPRRVRQSEVARRPARDQDRAVSRRRRHAAHRAHDAARRRAAIPAQGRPDQARAGQGHEDRRRGGAGGRSHRRPRRSGSRTAASRRTRGTWTVSGCPAGSSIPRPA